MARMMLAAKKPSHETAMVVSISAMPFFGFVSIAILGMFSGW
jgi:hypothetical protein